MNENYNSSQRDSMPKGAQMRKGIVFCTMLAVVIGAILLLTSLKTSHPTSRERVEIPALSKPELETPPLQKPAPPPDEARVITEQSRVVQSSSSAVPGVPSARQLLAEMAELSGASGSITREQAEKFKQNLAELIRQGASSVPAIRELLAKNQDSYYADVSGGDQLGYSSLRASLFDALKQIGGPEARAAMLATLQTSALPAELLELAKNLEQGAPGQYRDQILNAAREAANMAAANQLGSNVEVGPVFRILQTSGEANTIADEARNDPSSFYNAIAMANLPNGQGLPSLIQMAENPSGGSQTIATEMIAQLAGQNAQAVETLAQMAQNGQIANNVWMRLAPILGGDQYQIANSPVQSSGADPAASGNQNYEILNGVTTADQINQRIALIDKFLGFVSQDSSAASSLQHERGILMGKLGK